MAYIQEQAAERVNTGALAQFLALATVAMTLPFLVHLQWLTGPIVNAVLILALFLVGIRAALVLALVPSLMALSSGLLPAVLAPVVPFIMISNVILVLSIEYFYKNAKKEFNGYWLGVLIGAAGKFLFLYFNVSLIVGLLMKKEVSDKVILLMSWPQFVTAVLGGMIAWGILKWLKRI